MMKKNGFPRKTSDKTLARDMILLCSNTVGRETAQEGIRAFFHSFGGQMIYIPIKKDKGESAEKIRKVLAAAVGKKPAQEILKKLMFRFGGLQIYIPLERHAFRKTIALEIYERNYTKNESLNYLAQEYNISFSYAYTLWREGQKDKFHGQGR